MSYVTDAGLQRDETFDIGGPADYDFPDPMYDDGRGERSKCTCGYAAAMHEAEHYDHDDYPSHRDFLGCAGCDPVDWECKPYGWGIEFFEDEARIAAAFDCWHGQWRGGPYHRVRMDDGERMQRVDAATSIDRDLLRRSDRAWDHICNGAECHKQAIARYTRWIERKLTHARRPAAPA